MGRTLGWAALLAAAGAVLWLLLGEVTGPGPAAPAGPLDASAADTQPSGPGLKSREGPPLQMQAEDDARGEASIHGIVMAEDGTPLAGVRVAAFPRPRGRSQSESWRRRTALACFEAPGVPGRLQAWADSDADGRFEITGLESNRGYHVVAQVAAPRFSSAQDWTAVVGRRWVLRVVVGEGAPLRGRVVDADGNGAKGWVSVGLQGTLGTRAYVSATWRPAPFETGPDGRFELPAVPAGTLLFQVTVLGRGSRSNLPVDTPTSEEVVLPFEEPGGATVEGRVTDTAGRGIAGAKVVVRSAPEGGGGLRSTTSRAAVSDAEGSFRVQRLSPGIIQGVSALAEGYVSSLSLAAGMPLGLQQPTRVDIVLARGARIEGRTLDPEGRPVAGATVVASRIAYGYGGWNQQLVDGESDEQGRFVLGDVPLGPGQLLARAEGWYQPPRQGQVSPVPWMAPPTGVVYDAAEEGQVLQRDVDLARGRTLRGTVKDGREQPVAGAVVTLSVLTGGSYFGMPGQQAPTISDAQGAFEIPGAAPDRTYQLQAGSETQVGEPVKVTVAGDADPEPLVLRLSPGCTVRGRVREADGRPAAGAVVTCTGGGRSAVADARGAFEIVGIPPGKVSVQVGDVDPLPESAKSALTLQAGATQDGVELVMPVTLAICGVVVGPDDKPLQGISVQARVLRDGRSRGRTRQASTDTKGRFEVMGLGEGDYEVWAGRSKESPVRAGDEGLRLVYEEPEYAVVEGRVLDPEGKAVPQGSLRVWYGPAGQRNSQTQGSITGGYFRVRLATTEEMVDLEVVMASDAAGRPLNFLPDRELDVALGAPVELRLSRGLELAGRVVDAAGRGIAGVQVRVDPRGQGRNYGWNPYAARNSVLSDEQGRWSVGGLKDGDYTVTATPGGEWVTPDKLEVHAGDADVTVELLQGLEITGRVVDPEGAPLVAANVWLDESQRSRAARGSGNGGRDWASAMRLRTTTDADGRFGIRGLPEDAWFHVHASANGQEQAYVATTISDVASGTRDLLVQLAPGLVIEGRVFDDGGRVLGGGSVQARPADPKAGQPGASSSVQGDGTFRLGPLQAGRYVVTVSPAGNQHATPAVQEVDAGAHGLRFECPPARSLTGRVLGEDVQGFYAMFVDERGNSSGTSVSPNGTFSLPKVQAERGRLYVYRPGDERYGEIPDVVVGEPVEVQLHPGLSIRGVVDGLPRGVRVQVYAQVEGVWVAGVTQPDGRFVVAGLPEGRFRVQAWVSGGSVAPREDVAAGTAGVVLVYRENR